MEESQQQQQETSQRSSDDGDLTHPTPPLLQLPPEILLHILSFLSLPQRCQLARVCQRLRDMGQDSSMWRSLHIDFRADKGNRQLRRSTQRLQDLLQNKKPKLQHFVFNPGHVFDTFDEDLMNSLLSCAGATLKTINIRLCELPAVRLLFKRLGQCERMREVTVDILPESARWYGPDLLPALCAVKVPESLSVLRLSGYGYSGQMTLGGDWKQLRELEVPGGVTELTFEGRWDQLEVLGV